MRALHKAGKGVFRVTWGGRERIHWKWHLSGDLEEEREKTVWVPGRKWLQVEGLAGAKALFWEMLTGSDRECQMPDARTRASGSGGMGRSSLRIWETSWWGQNYVNSFSWGKEWCSDHRLDLLYLGTLGLQGCNVRDGPHLAPPGEGECCFG